MRIAACIVTRGDVPLDEVLEPIPDDWEVVVWNNEQRADYSVFGRYMAITLTDADVIFVQDDDAVLDPETFDLLLAAYEPGVLVSNMPSRFRHDFYTDSCLVGFGALFDRDLPKRAFDRFIAHHQKRGMFNGDYLFLRECDLVFTALTPRVLVDGGHRDLPHAHADDRLWKQPNHVHERKMMLELVRQVPA